MIARRRKRGKREKMGNKGGRGCGDIKGEIKDIGRGNKKRRQETAGETETRQRHSKTARQGASQVCTTTSTILSSQNENYAQKQWPLAISLDFFLSLFFFVVVCKRVESRVDNLLFLVQGEAQERDGETERQGRVKGGACVMLR